MDEQVFVNLLEKFIILFKTQGNDNEIPFRLTKILEEYELKELEIKQSNIHGFGVFAKKNIDPGKVVAVYPCHVMMASDNLLYDNNHKEKIDSRLYENYYCKLPNNNIIFSFPDMCKGCLVAHFINDSFNFNQQIDEQIGKTLVQYILNSSKNNNCIFKYSNNYVYVCTTKFIDKDQELVCSYGYEYWFKNYNSQALVDHILKLDNTEKEIILKIITDNFNLSGLKPTFDNKEFSDIIHTHKIEQEQIENNSTNLNVERHRNSDSLYAHFSLVNTYNYLLFPNLLFTSPIHITLNAGESLYIPKKWWHWVKTTKKSFAINYWFDNKTMIDPFVFKYKQKLNLNNIRETVYVWNSTLDTEHKPSSFKQFYNSGLDNLYVITLNHFQNDNKNLKKSLQNVISFPTGIQIDTPEIFDYNIWASSGKHDTGLHYDDEDGILTLVDGTKDIILFPPLDTPYLYKLDVSYKWLNDSALNFHYNSYQFISKTHGTSSSRLLYETCKHDLKVLANVSKLYNEYKEMSDYVIWGFKKDKLDCRWELYSYFPKNIENVHIVSRDIYPETYHISPEIHMYYNNDDEVNLPFWGCGKFINPYTKKVYNEGEIFVIDTTESFLLNYTDYMERLGYSHIIESFRELVFKYNCYEISIHNKNKDTIFIQYLGISNNDFVCFLKDNNYDNDIIKLVDSDYNINNEITIVYDLMTQEVIRSAIYGVLN